MKKPNFLPIVLFACFFICSCDDKLDEMEQELYDKIIGSWKVITQTHLCCPRGSSCNSIAIVTPEMPKTEPYFYGFDFLHNGDVIKVWKGAENERHATWRIENYSIKIKLIFRDDTRCNIQKFTDTEFYFSLSIPSINNSTVTNKYELKR
jgi:hypothetical protein